MQKFFQAQRAGLKQANSIERLTGRSASAEPPAKRARRLLRRKALLAAAASAVPIPGLDWAVDAALLSRLLPQINAEFGLSAEQIDALDPKKREQVQKAVTMVGSLVIGRLVTRDLALKAARALGLRMTTRQLSKYVPFAGQAMAAALGYATLVALGEKHIQDCIEVATLSQVSALPEHGSRDQLRVDP